MNKIPPTVYKYRDWRDQFHKNILLQNELYFCSAQDFNDPFDCRISPNFFLLSRSEIHQYINDFAITHFLEAEKRGLNLVKELQELELRFKNIEKFQEEHDIIEYDYFDKYFGILSLSARWNSVLLWSHYANSHAGFCVGFNEYLLRNSLLPRAVGCGVVEYNEKYPEIKPKVYKDAQDTELMKERFIKSLRKSSDWTYEEEYRIFINYFPYIPTINDRKILIPEKIITEVILGLKMSLPYQNEIIKICESKNIPVFKAKKDRFNFEITKVLIK